MKPLVKEHVMYAWPPSRNRMRMSGHTTGQLKFGEGRSELQRGQQAILFLGVLI